jgi:hypothetical protein
MPKLGSGEIQFQGLLLGPATAICFCSHKPTHVPDRDRILAYLTEHGIDLSADFSLVLDATGKEDVVLVFGNPQTLRTFQLLVSSLVEMEREIEW